MDFSLFKKIFIKNIYYIFFGMFLFLPNQAHSGLSLIRDAEIEHTLKVFSLPLFEAANINPESVSIHIVNDKSLNAYVSKGRNLFIHTGLIMATESPGQVIGVIAHETGHIAGGHIVRLLGQNEKTGKAMLLSTLAGGLAMLASGRADVGSAVAMGGMSSSMGGYFSHRRSEENSADEFAAKILDETKQSSLGLYQFLKKINHNDALISDDNDPYFHTHPLTPERISFIENHIKHSQYTNEPASPEFVMMHKVMVAKLKAFLENPLLTLEKYPKTDDSLIARYSRAIALYRKLKIDDAIKELDSLTKDYPENPYFYELKGQILFEHSRIEESLPCYQKAVEKLPDNSLLMVGYANALLETESKDNTEKAIYYLRKVVGMEQENASAWRLLATAYGKDANMANAVEASAEYSFLLGDIETAKLNAQKAIKLLDKDSPSWLRMKDILQEAKNYNKND